MDSSESTARVVCRRVRDRVSQGDNTRVTLTGSDIRARLWIHARRPTEHCALKTDAMEVRQLESNQNR